MKNLRHVIFILTAIVTMITPARANAVDYYFGNTFLQSDSANFCVIIRFRTYDGSFSLTEADALYNILSNAVTGVSLLDSFTVSHTLPSTNHADGKTGEGVASAFRSSGVGICTVGGVPVDALIFISAFNCVYQDENQMCIRLYADMGETDLSALGIHKGPASFGGIFIKREIWDALSGLIISNPGLIPPVPLAAPLSAQVESLLTNIDTGSELKQGIEDFELFNGVVYTDD